MATRIALSEDQFGQLIPALDTDQESAAVLAASLVTDLHAGSSSDLGLHGASSLLIRTVTWVPEDAYLERTEIGLSIASPGWVPAFRAAVADDTVPVFVHTHPAGDAAFSHWDDDVDAALAEAARDFGARAYASIVVAGRSAAPQAIARMVVFEPPGTTAPAATGLAAENVAAPEFVTVDAIRIAGGALRLLLPPTFRHHQDEPHPPERTTQQPVESSSGSHAETDPNTFDRQVRMLGDDGQRTLHELSAAVIGVGGTGSAVAVQLARLGVGEILLVDDDTVTAPTPTRGHGMRVSDIGRPKVGVLGQHLIDIGLGTRVVEIAATLHEPAALRAVQHADVVFSCVDGHGARLILNRYAYAHLTAVIDLAVLVAVTEPSGSMTRAHVEVDERVTWIGPGTACLLCRGRLDAALAYAENLDPAARKQLAGEGYVAAAETPQPAVVTLTTLVAALGATEFLLRLTGIGSTEATELLLRPHVGDLRRNRVPQRPGCFCSDPNYLGRGQRSPYLDLMWPAVPLGEPA